MLSRFFSGYLIPVRVMSLFLASRSPFRGASCRFGAAFPAYYPSSSRLSTFLAAPRRGSTGLEELSLSPHKNATMARREFHVTFEEGEVDAREVGDEWLGALGEGETG